MSRPERLSRTTACTKPRPQSEKVSLSPIIAPVNSAIAAPDASVSRNETEGRPYMKIASEKA